MGLLTRFTLKQLLFNLQILAFIPWLIGVFLAFYFVYPEIKNARLQISAEEHLLIEAPLLWNLQRHRGLSYLYLSFLTNKEKEETLMALKEIEREIEDTFKKLSTLSLDVQHGKELIQKFKKTYEALKIEKFKGSAEENFFKHTELINQVILFLNQDAEKHKLFAEPDLYLRTLAQVSLMELPRFIEYLGRTRAIVSSALAKGGLTNHEKEMLLDYYEVLSGYNKNIKWILENIKLPEDTLLKLRNSQDLFEVYRITLRKYLAQDFRTKEMTGLEFFRFATITIDAFIDFHEALLRKYLEMIKAQKEGLFKRLGFLISGITLVLIVISLSFYMAYRYVVLRLRKVSEGVKRIAEGDLSMRVSLEGRDEIAEFVSVLNFSLSELEKRIKEIEFMLWHDYVTGAPNREKLLYDLKAFSNPILVLVDINSFKSINFVYGTKAGDILLKEVYQRLKEVFHGEVYRVGADEFALILEAHEEKKEEEIKKELQGKIEVLTKTPFSIDHERLSLNFTVCALCEITEPDKILTDAYSLLDETKARGENFYCEFNPGERFKKIHEENLHWLDKFRKALSEGRIVPFYQPIIDNQTKRPVKFEALVRLIDENGEIVSPFKFLTLAQKAGYGPKITKTVLQKALDDFLFLPYEISVNLSYNDFLQEESLQFIEDILLRREKPALVFEFLETEEIGNPQLVFSKLKEIKARGIKLAIDDFGSGYSSLQRLIDLGVDYIKIDASLIKRLPEDEKVQLLVKALVRFAKEAGIKTVAEFVADEVIYQKVCEFGIDYSQGYYFSPPLSLEEIKKFLNKYL